MADEEGVMLAYFNRTFEIYDQLRLRAASISRVRSYLRSLNFTDDVERFFTLDYIVRLIDTYEQDDERLMRCKKEVEKITSPLRAVVLKPGNTPDIESSPVWLSSKKGTKIDFIRVFNAMYDLGFFTDAHGGKITKRAQPWRSICASSTN